MPQEKRLDETRARRRSAPPRETSATSSWGAREAGVSRGYAKNLFKSHGGPILRDAPFETRSAGRSSG
ncbi:hypothetical protein B1812_11040 [Methylocystis bryophila]|uniref:Uncharacterized protein n=1 Tax=Methylocystis bryophila TaxID=655015 RepID=A0A1W6MVK7_9HYPH|nr:hypothetical protein B1812_11040 [Methylocystis bryophila]